jgi:magnesium chelatase subunit I
MANPKPQTIGELKATGYKPRSVKDEIRRNLILRLRNENYDDMFPGIVGYGDTVLPQVINALLARHNLILLGLRGQAKSTILRLMTDFLDEEIPIVAGSEINDDPARPISAYARDLIEERGDETPIEWVAAEDRYIEKLATPDVTIADIIGDVDPIRAVREGRQLSDEMTIHYGLLPRANRGIFAINELPDLAGKIQVGLFNIMQEGDIQIKGYPIRMPVDVLLVFTANPEDYTARGKIITPLKDRIGAEIHTHYLDGMKEAIKVTKSQAWTDRNKGVPAEERVRVVIPDVVRELVEKIAFIAREDKRIDKRSGVSQRMPITVLEAALSNSERRALFNCSVDADLNLNLNGAVRISDVYAALPAITGKLELEYEGEQIGAARMAKDLIRKACGDLWAKRFEGVEYRRVLDFFNQGNEIVLGELMSDEEAIELLRKAPGLEEAVRPKMTDKSTPANYITYCELFLDGLHANKKIERRENQDGATYTRATIERPIRRQDFDDWGGGRIN